MTDTPIGAAELLSIVGFTALAASGATYLLVDARITAPIRDRWVVLADKRAGKAEERMASAKPIRRAVAGLAGSLWAAGAYLASCSWCSGAWVTALTTVAFAGDRGVGLGAGVLVWMASWWLVGLGATVVDLLDVTWEAVEARKRTSGGAGGSRP